MSDPIISMIWCQTVYGIIGKEGKLPWHLPEDLAFFKSVTDGHPVIMGRKTWDSLPDIAKPLPNRTNIIVTRQDLSSVNGDDRVIYVNSLQDAIEAAKLCAGSDEIFLIGGSSIFEEGMDIASTIYLTEIYRPIQGDTHAPEISMYEWDYRPYTGGYSKNQGLYYTIDKWVRKEEDAERNSAR